MNLAEARWFAIVASRSTTRSDRTAVWATTPRPSSPQRVPLPLRLRLRSSSTREPKTSQPLPNPYSHNQWYRKSGQVNRTRYDRGGALLKGDELRKRRPSLCLGHWFSFTYSLSHHTGCRLEPRVGKP